MTFEQYKLKLQAKVKLRVEIEDILVNCREYILSNEPIDFISSIIIEEFGGIRLSVDTFKIYKTYLNLTHENNLIKIVKSACN